jgi:DNA-binding LacI/PurR family transcriptional regulator
LAGVSQATVSRVFAGGTAVSEKKRKKVLEAAAKLNYALNAHARSLTTRRTRIIGIVMRNIGNPFYSAVLEIFYDRLSVLGYHILFINSENEEVKESEIRQLIEYNVEGVIITDALLSSPASEKFNRSDIAVILFNRYSAPSKGSAVFCDNYMAAKQIATYLLETGHRKFAFISGPSTTSTTLDRLKGFRERLQQKGVHDLIIEAGDYTYENGFRSAQELVTRHSDIDCMFCGNDIIALGAMDGLKIFGYHVPDDISIVGFDNIRMSAWPSYSLTTWEQPLEEMVDATVKILMEEIKHKAAKPKVKLMKGKMIIRNSVKSRK